MALQQLSDEQVRTWTRAQKDEWWLHNVFRGDMPQLTIRSGITGFLLGGVLAATALYIAAKTGISIGVGLTSVILAFALYRIMHGAGIATDFTILENNCTQSIATAAGYMVSPLISSLAAYMLVTERMIPWQHLIIVDVRGVDPRRPARVPDEAALRQRRAAAVSGRARERRGARRALHGPRRRRHVQGAAPRARPRSGRASTRRSISDGWMKLLQFKILRMDQWAGMKEPWTFHDRLDTYYYAAAAKANLYIPTILGTDIRQLGLRLTLDAAMLGIGGLMGIAVATSCLLGAFINFVILAPIMIQAGDIVARIGPTGAVVPISRAEIVNQWSLWWGVTMMVVGSLVSLFGRPRDLPGTLQAQREGRRHRRPRAHRIPAVDLRRGRAGLQRAGRLGLATQFFGVPWFLAFISLPLIFVLSVICTNSMALTSWTPTGALSKITQFSMGAIDRTNPASNLIPAGMTGEIAANAANLLSDIKPGYMLGGKPRQQAVGHVIGIFAGAFACVPLFFLLFLPPDANGVRSVSTMVSDNFAFPAALQWKGVAELIAKGCQRAALVGGRVDDRGGRGRRCDRDRAHGHEGSVSALRGFDRPRRRAAARVHVRDVGGGDDLLGDAAQDTRAEGTPGNRFWVEGMEPICAGLISGSALMGIGNAIVNVLMN